MPYYNIFFVLLQGGNEKFSKFIMKFLLKYFAY